MRRGLMGWNAEELPLAVLQDRTARLQAAMQQHGLQALLLYTNLVRPSAVTWLTGFTPYWSEGLLLVARHGAPTFATALSKRVANWIRSVSPLGEIVNGPRPGTVLGQRVAADASVRRVLARADAIAAAALEEVDGAGTADAGSVAGQVEKHARLAGAEEVYITVAPDLRADRRMIRASPSLALGDVYGLRVSLAYKGCWIRRARTFASDQRASGRPDAWFANLVQAIAPGRPLAEQIAAQVRPLGAELENWMAESCVGSYPLQVVASSHLPGGRAPVEGDFTVLTIALTAGGVPWLGTAPLIVGGRL